MKYFESSPCTIIDIFKLNICNRVEWQSMEDYISKLRKQAKTAVTCNYSDILEYLLRDRHGLV